MTIRNVYKRLLSCTFVLTMLHVLPAAAQAPDEIPLGSAMPMAGTNFVDVQGGQASLGSLAGERGTVVVFWSNQCPWIERYEDRFSSLVSEFSGRGMSFVIVNSNDAGSYPQESAEASADRFDSGGYPSALTYLADPSSQLARAFGAERTPHVYVFDEAATLVYVGAIDDSPGDPGSVQDSYLRDALNSVVGGSPVAAPQTKAFGCTIKYAG